MFNFDLNLIRSLSNILILSNRAINYVFSSNNNVGKNWPSPYTKKSIDYVLSTTKDNKNTWVTVKANVQKDFKKLHEIDVTEHVPVIYSTWLLYLVS